MCFSAQASFLTAGLLIIISILSFKQVKSYTQLPLALIPFLFAIQQATEGIVWLTRSYQASFIFLIFAFLVWPIWMPFSLYILEPFSKSKKYLLYCLCLGIVWSLYALGSLSTYNITIDTLCTTISCAHINYQVFIPGFTNLAGIILYNCASTLPFFISSMPYMKFLGIALTTSCIATLIIWNKFFTSIWCFFAALLSIAVYYILQKINLKQKNIQ